VSSVWLIPALPLLGALVNMVFGRAIGRRAHWVAVPAVAGAFILAGGPFSVSYDIQYSGYREATTGTKYLGPKNR